jgi:hypothetical protein
MQITPNGRRGTKHGTTAHPSLAAFHGPGIFYSGRVNFDSEVFTYVYDCGSDSLDAKGRKPVIVRFGRTVENQKPLDALFISHFDRDHVNGLKELLKHRRIGGAATVFLPYLTPILRLALAAHKATTSRISFTPDERDFLANPTKWLVSMGAKKVVYVYGDGPGGSDSPPRLPEPTFDAPESTKLRFESSPESPEWLGVAERDLDSQVAFMSHLTAVLANPSGVKDHDWLLLTFVDDLLPGADSVAKEIEKFLGSKAQRTLSDATAMSDFLADNRNVTKLRNAYKRAVGTGNMNGTSMCLYSGPLEDASFLDSRWWSPEAGTRSGVYPELPTRTTWLLLGDAELSDRYSVCDRLLDFFSRFRSHSGEVSLLDRIDFISAPHHGSGRNCSTVLFDKIRANVCVISAGLHSPHAHPDERMIESLIMSGTWFSHTELALVHEGSGPGLLHYQTFK